LLKLPEKLVLKPPEEKNKDTIQQWGSEKERNGTDEDKGENRRAGIKKQKLHQGHAVASFYLESRTISS